MVVFQVPFSLENEIEVNRAFKSNPTILRKYDDKSANAQRLHAFCILRHVAQWITPLSLDQSSFPSPSISCSMLNMFQGRNQWTNTSAAFRERVAFPVLRAPFPPVEWQVL